VADVGWLAEVGRRVRRKVGRNPVRKAEGQKKVGVGEGRGR
jgi:hypothetical protein